MLQAIRAGSILVEVSKGESERLKDSVVGLLFRTMRLMHGFNYRRDSSTAFAEELQLIEDIKCTLCRNGFLFDGTFLQESRQRAYSDMRRSTASGLRRLECERRQLLDLGSQQISAICVTAL